MDHPFERYYQDQPLRHIVEELSDPRLDVDKHREKVNALVMSLVIQYLGKYLKVPTRDPRAIGEAARRGKERMKTKRVAEKFHEKMIRGALSGDIDAGKTNDDASGLDCLMDTAATAALFKEVAFSRHERKGEMFVGADFGSGTGILTLATAIAGRRSGAQAPFTLGLDREKVSIQRATEVLSDCLSPREIQLQAVDIRTPGLVGALFRGLPLHLWVSETVSEMTPSMRVEGGRLVYTGNDTHALAMQMINMAIEPYFDVLANTIKERPQFLRDVESGATTMFPDLVRGAFIPDERRGAALKLGTSTSPRIAAPLSRVGAEFWAYEQPVRESVTDPRWARFPANDSL